MACHVDLGARVNCNAAATSILSFLIIYLQKRVKCGTHFDACSLEEENDPIGNAAASFGSRSPSFAHFMSMISSVHKIPFLLFYFNSLQRQRLKKEGKKVNNF